MSLSEIKLDAKEGSTEDSDHYVYVLRKEDGADRVS